MVEASTEIVESQLTEFDEAYLAAVSALPKKIRLPIERISAEIKQNGLSLEEACLIANIDAEWLDRAITTYPIIPRIFAKKDLEFRMALMRPLIKRATQDDKMAQYLLELRMPKLKKGGPADDSGDMLAAAISHIQEHGDSTPLVNRTQNTAVFLGRGASAKQLMEKIKKLLPHDHMA